MSIIFKDFFCIAFLGCYLVDCNPVFYLVESYYLIVIYYEKGHKYLQQTMQHFTPLKIEAFLKNMTFI